MAAQSLAITSLNARSLSHPDLRCQHFECPLGVSGVSVQLMNSRGQLAHPAGRWSDR
ncbi:protein of unknown function [Methylorubrum extorquens]|uniref:Uncharacterized protein n=1 Tax=Methylorubrum extorquens TaxID=408 RepID=A0A2N9AXK1_METEX|nr:protein of unknown function [Methylorubrum extorquens]